MKKTISLAIVGLTFLGAVLARSTTFEVTGSPLTLHQAQVTALTGLQVRAATQLLEQNGIPVSPVQMLVLGHPRPGVPHEVVRSDWPAGTKIWLCKLSLGDDLFDQLLAGRIDAGDPLGDVASTFEGVAIASTAQATAARKTNLDVLRLDVGRRSRAFTILSR